LACLYGQWRRFYTFAREVQLEAKDFPYLSPILAPMGHDERSTLVGYAGGFRLEPKEEDQSG
jgi:hypothetical protein